MKNVLFVDDEKQILKAFRRAFIDSSFQVKLASSGEEALALLKEGHINLVISDMRMPKMDGYSLLSQVKVMYPEVLRVILSGYSDERVVFKALKKNIAKLYLFKPWDNEVLEKTIIGILKTQDLLTSHHLMRVINEIEELPTTPVSYNKILKLIEEDASEKIIGTAIEKDQAIASQVLHIANSAYYGKKTGSVQEAIFKIGLEGTRELILSTSIIQAFSGERVLSRKIEEMWGYAFVVNKLVQFIYKEILERPFPSEYQATGLLHNIGCVFLLTLFGKDYLHKKVEAKNSHISMCEMEKRSFGITHTEAGGFLMSWWGFPFPIIEATLYHHDPFNEAIIHKKLVAVVHIAQYYGVKLLGIAEEEKLDLGTYTVIGCTQKEFEKNLKAFQLNK